MSDDISLTDVLDASHERHLGNIHTALPGRIVKYDSAAMTADIEIDIKRPWQNGDGTLAYEVYSPTLPAIPVQFPRCGAYAITFPLVPGDTVLLLFFEAAIGEWRQGNMLAEPGDTRTHSLGYCVAIPGLLPDAKTTTNAAIDALTLGVGGSGTEKIEISSSGGIVLGHGATKTLAFGPALSSLLTALSTFSTALGTAVPAGAGATSTLSSALGLITAVETTKVKAL